MNIYFNHDTPLLAGTLATAEEVNDIIDGIVTGFATVETDVGTAITLSNADVTNTDIPDAFGARSGKVLGFSATGVLNLQAGVGDFKGDWAVDTAYSVRDYVRDSVGSLGLNNLYVAIDAHISSSAPDTILTDTAHWTKVIDLTDVVTAKVAAETAQGLAETAQGLAETAQGLAEDWASFTTGIVDTTDYSAKAYAVGGIGVTGAAGAAKEWATTITGAVDGSTGYAAKAWAIGGNGVTSTAGRGAAKEWAITLEDTTVDGTSFSALHWAAKAETWALSTNLPTLAGAPDATKMLEVNAGGTGYDLIPSALSRANHTDADPTLEVTGEAYFTAEIDNGNSGTGKTIDWTAGNKQKVAMTGNCTFTFTPPSGATGLTFRMIQDAGGTNTAAWPATVKWSNGVEPAWETSGDSVNIASFYFDGTNYWGVGSAAFA